MLVSFAKLLHSGYDTILVMNYIFIIFKSLFKYFCSRIIYRSKCFVNPEISNLPNVLS